MATLQEPSSLDEAKLNAFFGQVLGDWGSTLGTAMAVIGDKLGLYEALQGGPLTVEGLADLTNTNRRYVREWLLNQAAAGYLSYDAASECYSLPAEHAAVLGQAFGGFQSMLALVKAQPRITEAFRTGQ